MYFIKKLEFFQMKESLFLIEHRKKYIFNFIFRREGIQENVQLS